MSRTTGASKWDAARRQARQLESSLDAKLTEYSRIASELSNAAEGSSSAYGAYATNSGSSGHRRDHTSLSMDGSVSTSGKADPRKQEEEIEVLLSEFTQCVDQLTVSLEDPNLPPSTVQLHAVQRHREVLMDLQRDFRQMKNNVQHAIDRRDLLGNVQRDIDSYKSKYASDTDALLAERSRLDNSHGMIDRTLDQAYATRADLSSQRDLIGSIASRMTTTAQSLPGINGVITMIGRRRRRDSIIMGLVIGGCTVLILMYLTSGR